MIGFDPRGVGTSTPIDCGDADTVNAYIVTDYHLETQADVDAANPRNATLGRVARRRPGPSSRTWTPCRAARDMDVIRALVGDEKLNYLGFSYGTQLGATYAELYPDKVGHMVLDGAVDFLLASEEQAAGQARASRAR